MKFIKGILSVIVIAACFAGSQASAARFHVYPRRVVIGRGHVHTVGCGHYYYRHHWYYLPAHVHGPHCGHVFVNGGWVARG
jgi:hypothetical protein